MNYIFYLKLVYNKIKESQILSFFNRFRQARTSNQQLFLVLDIDSRAQYCYLVKTMYSLGIKNILYILYMGRSVTITGKLVV